jgi:hypothetical protein
MSNYIKTYLESPSLLLYQPKVEVSDDRVEDPLNLSSNNENN